MQIKKEYEIFGDVAYKTETEKVRDYNKETSNLLRWVQIPSGLIHSYLQGL